MQNISGGKTALNFDNNMGALVCYLNICLPFGTIYSIIVLVTDKICAGNLTKLDLFFTTVKFFI